jgi:hypothetical protein
MHLDTVIRAAQATLRGQYARDTVAGRQRWSGADLKGKAARYGASYYVQRRKARAALFAAGGCVLTVDHGRDVTAVRVSVDDYGNEVFDTPRGLAVVASAHRARLIGGAL